MKFYKCNKCGNILAVCKDGAIVPKCCDELMTVLKSNSDETGSSEKHIPTFNKNNNLITINVGSTLHPSTSDHYIEWIMLETDKKRYIKYLKSGDTPSITISLSNDDENVINIYAYCNIHGLWSIH